jgi:hypothetical protein
MIREELLRALAKRYGGKKDKYTKPTDWSPKRRDDENDDGPGMHVAFIHIEGAQVYESDVIRTTVEEWQRSDRAKDDAWGIVRCGQTIYAMKIRTYRGNATPAVKPQATRAEASRRLPPPGRGVHFREVTSTDKTQSVLVAEMSARKWRATHGQLPGTWVVVKENCRSVTAVQLPE